MQLAGLGMAAFLSYGVVSNVTYGTCLTLSWITFVKQVGACFLPPGHETGKWYLSPWS